jgi:hypothetical protein
MWESIFHISNHLVISLTLPLSAQLISTSSSTFSSNFLSKSTCNRFNSSTNPLESWICKFHVMIPFLIPQIRALF